MLVELDDLLRPILTNALHPTTIQKGSPNIRLNTNAQTEPQDEPLSSALVHFTLSLELEPLFNVCAGAGYSAHFFRKIAKKKKKNDQMGERERESRPRKQSVCVFIMQILHESSLEKCLLLLLLLFSGELLPGKCYYYYCYCYYWKSRNN